MWVVNTGGTCKRPDFCNVFYFQIMIFRLLVALTGWFLSLSLYAQTPSKVPYRQGNLWGYSNGTGKVVITPSYERTWFYSSDGLARIQQNGSFGFIDREGNRVIEPQFQSASDFYLGLAEVEKDGRKYCINMEGIEEECSNEEELEEEPEQVLGEDLFSILKDSLGYKLIIMSSMDTVDQPYEKISIISKYFFPQTSFFAVVSNKGKYGVYDQQGMLVAPVEFQEIEVLDMDTYKGKKKNLWGVGSFNGDKLLPFEYDHISKVSEVIFREDRIQRIEHYIVKKKNKYGIVNHRNQVQAKLVYDEIQIPETCNCPMEFVVRQNNLYGLLNEKGHTLIAPKYSSITPFQGSSFTLVKTTGGKEGYISLEGLEYFTE